MKSLKELRQTPQYWSAKLSTEIYNLYLNHPDTIGLTNRHIKTINDGEAAESLPFEQIAELLERMGFVLTYEIKKMDK